MTGICPTLAAEPLRTPTPGLSIAPTDLIAHRFVPAQPGPWPAVVLLHGCGGAYDRQGKLSARSRQWGEEFARLGYFALVVDSFSVRGLREICTLRHGERPLKTPDRVGDAAVVLAWLRQQPEVAADRIGLLGWSHGGAVTLESIGRARPENGGFKAAVAFYPGCTASLNKVEEFHPYAPLLVLIGATDDWTPALPCQVLTAQVAARGEPMHIITYPDTYHDFDNPALHGVRVRHDVPNGIHPGRGVTIAPNPAAREEARRRVADFFAQHLAPPGENDH